VYHNNVFYIICDRHDCVVNGNVRQNVRAFVMCLEIISAIIILFNGARTEKKHTYTHMEIIFINIAEM
jgi:hypothetical protein